MPATTYAINKSLDKDFGATDYTPPATYYLGLSTTAIDSTGSTVTEPTDPSYARVAITNNKSKWSTAASGSVVSLTTASFVQSSQAWGTIISAFLSSASVSTSGSIWFYYTLNPSIPVVANTTVTFSAGTLTATRT